VLESVRVLTLKPLYPENAPVSGILGVVKVVVEDGPDEFRVAVLDRP
jgi:hypothetical protein